MKITEVLKNGLSFESIDAISEFCKKYEGKAVVIELRGDRKRTNAQGNALHLWFGAVAEGLNTVGAPLLITNYATGQAVPIEREWTYKDVKYNIFYPVMQAITKKESTAKLDKNEIDQCVKPIQEDFLVKCWKLEVRFPNEEDMDKPLINYLD